ncbi:MAG: hypothetical protein HYX68_00615 [Planctomycetes bacterium]|nr:hypothetical protein [Planctomycetota bacterium]
MAYMFEIYYQRPADPSKETALTTRVAAFGGRLDYREDETDHTGIILTYEFDDRANAMKAADLLHQVGEHVVGPMDYAA